MYCMRCHTSHNRETKQLQMNRHISIETTADKFGVTKPTYIPVSTGEFPMSKKDTPQTLEEKAEMNDIPFRGLLGALM